MSVQTIWASIVNFFHIGGTLTTKLSRLKTAAEADYDALIAKAEAASASTLTKVSDMAHVEAGNLLLSAQRLAARAAALKATETLLPAVAARVDAVQVSITATLSSTPPASTPTLSPSK